MIFQSVSFAGEGVILLLSAIIYILSHKMGEKSSINCAYKPTKQGALLY